MKILPRDLQNIILDFVPRDKFSKGKTNDIIKPEIEIYNSFKNVWDITFVEFILGNNRFYKHVFRLLFGMSSLSPELLNILADLSPSSNLDFQFDDFSSTSSEFSEID